MPRRLKQASKKVFACLFGIIFIVFGVGLVAGVELYWARVVVPQRKSLGTAISILPNNLDPQNDGKLVHVIGGLNGTETLKDSEFNVAIDALRLRRRVWMWQWQQEKIASRSTDTITEQDPKTGQQSPIFKNTTRTYNYSQNWSEKLIDSRSFYNSGHDNPPEMKIPARAISAARISLGGFALSPELVEQIDNFQAVPVSEKNFSGLDASLRGKAKSDDEEIYISADPKRPAIGDLKIKLEFAPAATVSVIACKNGSQLSPFAVTKSESIALLFVGSHSIEDMTRQFTTNNLKWRAVGWGMGIVATLGGALILLAAKKST